MFPRANFATKDVLFAMKGNVGSKVCHIDKGMMKLFSQKGHFKIQISLCLFRSSSVSMLIGFSVSPVAMFVASLILQFV